MCISICVCVCDSKNACVEVCMFGFVRTLHVFPFFVCMFVHLFHVFVYLSACDYVVFSQRLE